MRRYEIYVDKLLKIFTRLRTFFASWPWWPWCLCNVNPGAVVEWDEWCINSCSVDRWRGGRVTSLHQSSSLREESVPASARFSALWGRPEGRSLKKNTQATTFSSSAIYMYSDDDDDAVEASSGQLKHSSFVLCVIIVSCISFGGFGLRLSQG